MESITERTLTIVCGLPGVGKTAVARLLSRIRTADLLGSDVLRKELLIKPTYGDAEKQAVYGEMFARAGQALLEGRNVVLDAAFNKASNRGKATSLAASLKAGFEIVLVTSSEEAIGERLRLRKGDESDADWRVYQFLKARFDRVDEPHVVITNDGDLSALEEQVERLLPE